MYVKASEARKFYAVSNDTLRRWDANGKIQSIRTKGKHRRYFISTNTNKQNFIYARVSSRKQQKDLQRQINYLSKKYPEYIVIKDIGSGLNFKRKGFNSILDKLYKKEINEIVVASRDRFTRFGFEFFQKMFFRFGAKLTSLSTPKCKEPEKELTEDLLSIITVFSARYYGRRKYSDKKNKNIPKCRTKKVF